MEFGGFKYENGAIYVGSWNNQGQKCGEGHLLLPNGARYDGNFENNLFNGLGVLSFPDGAKYWFSPTRYNFLSSLLPDMKASFQTAGSTVTVHFGVRTVWGTRANIEVVKSGDWVWSLSTTIHTVSPGARDISRTVKCWRGKSVRKSCSRLRWSLWWRERIRWKILSRNKTNFWDKVRFI